jgi:tetratricopeptide (TPR) repeat protein
MLNKKHTLIVSLIAAGMILLTGCDEHKKNQNQAKLRWEENSAMTNLKVVDSLMERGNYNEAEKKVTQALKAKPSFGYAHMLMGKILYAKGQTEAARQEFIISIELDKTLHHSWYYLGVISQQQKDSAKTLEYYNKAIELAPVEVNYSIALSQVHLTMGNSDKALDVLQKTLELSAQNVELQVAIADVLNRQGDVAGAIAMYTRALFQTPQDKEILRAIGYCYFADSQWKKAADTFGKLAARSTLEQRKAYYQILATCSMNASQFGRALKYYDLLTVDNRDDAALWLKMGYAALGANSPQKAYDSAQRALKTEPGLEDAIALRGCAEYLQKDYTRSIRTFRDIIGSDTNAHLAWVMIGRSYQQLSQTAKAAQAYEKALSLNPDTELASLISQL